jgi:Large polyvalent protein associated domain 29
MSTESAKQIRAQLKAAFPGQKFWVTSKNSIRVEWIDGPAKKEVEAIASKHQNVRCCERTGETLSGGNTFVFCERLYSEKR